MNILNDVLFSDNAGNKKKLEKMKNKNIKVH